MTEHLSEEDYQRLCEALEDGFPDMLGRRNPANKKQHGNVFATNPLGEEVSYFMPYEAPPSFLNNDTRQKLLTSKAGIYPEADSSREYFSLSPFGFNLEKLKAFFDTQVAEYRPLLKKEYDQYLKTAEYIPYEFLVDEPGFPDVFDGVYSYEQWEENIVVPYSKIWFDLEILRLINDALRPLSDPRAEAGLPSSSFAIKHETSRKMKTHFLLGRLVEHYKWKFRYESSLVARKLQFEHAGNSGGKASKTKRTARLEAYMVQVEILADLVGKIDESRILEQAWENACGLRTDMPKTPKIRFEYEVELRSIEPFKTRYEHVFRKNA